MGLKTFFQILFSFVPRYDAFLKAGFKPKIFNADFILTKQLKHYNLSLHQSVEPHNSTFGHLVDFDIESACLVIEMTSENVYTDRQITEVMELFDYSYHRKNFLFCMNKKMSLEDKRLPHQLKGVEEIFS